MFFRKNKEEEKPKVVKKVYNFDEDKSEKINISALFDKTTNDHKKDDIVNEEPKNKENHIKTSKLPQREEKVKFTINEIMSEENQEQIDESNESNYEEVHTEEEITEEYEHKKYILKKVFKYTILTAILISILVCIWALNSSVFLIKDITISNIDSKRTVSGESPSFVVDNLDAQIATIASASKGENIFTTDILVIKERIEQIPYVYRAEIIRSMPSTLNVKYSTRTPYAQIFANNQFIVVDKYGAVLDIVDYENYAIPTIKGINDNNYKSGDFILGVDDVKYKNIVFLLETAEKVDFEYTISNIKYESTDELIFTINEAGINVIYGEIDKENVNDKLLFLNAAISKSIEEGFKGTLDLSSENYYKSVLKRE